MVDLLVVKNYLRVDTDEDDTLITSLILAATNTCKSIIRIESEEDIEDVESFRIGVLYAVAYLYEHREDADHKELNLTLRSLLFGLRKPEF